MDEIELWQLIGIAVFLLFGSIFSLVAFILYRRINRAMQNIARQSSKLARSSAAQAKKNKHDTLARLSSLDHQITEFVETTATDNDKIQTRFNSLSHQITKLAESVVVNNNNEQITQEKLRRRYEKRSDQIDAALKNIHRSITALEKPANSQKLKERDQKNKEKIAALTAGLNAAEARSDMLRVELKKLHSYRRDAEKELSSMTMHVKEREERDAFAPSAKNSSRKLGDKPSQ